MEVTGSSKTEPSIFPRPCEFFLSESRRLSQGALAGQFHGPGGHELLAEGRAGGRGRRAEVHPDRAGIAWRRRSSAIYS